MSDPAHDETCAGTTVSLEWPCATPPRVEKTTPDAYRLAKKPDGTVVLQGAYMWQEGRNYGHEWRDIPTVEL